MTDDECSFTGDTSGCVIDMEPKVTYLGYVELVQDGAIVGTVDAVFDFSRVPPEHHGLAFGVLHRTRVGMIGKHELEDLGNLCKEVNERKPWWKFW